jgi:very-short-patch-repair endonuclease
MTPLPGGVAAGRGGKDDIQMNSLPFNRYLLQKAAENRKNMPPAEVRVWKRLRRQQLMQYDFDRQKPILNYIVDFYCQEAQLAIEIDGNTHNNDGEPERTRQRDIEELGVWFLRFPNLEAYKFPDQVAQSVLLALENWEEQNGIPDVVRQRRERLGIL